MDKKKNIQRVLIGSLLMIIFNHVLQKSAVGRVHFAAGSPRQGTANRTGFASQPESDSVEAQNQLSPGVPDPERQIVERTLLNLRQLPSLSFEVEVYQTSSSRLWFWPKLLSRYTTRMKPGKIQTRVFSDKKEVFIINDDGTFITEWSQKEWCRYPRPAHGNENVHLDIPINGCYFGSVLSSWLGNSSFSQLLEERLTQGQITGTEMFEDQKCLVLEYDRKGYNFQHTDKFYLDINRYLLVRWMGIQDQFLPGSNLVFKQVTRDHIYRKISTELIADSVYSVSPEELAGKRKVKFLDLSFNR